MLRCSIFILNNGPLLFLLNSNSITCIQSNIERNCLFCVWYEVKVAISSTVNIFFLSIVHTVNTAIPKADFTLMLSCTGWCKHGPRNLYAIGTWKNAQVSLAFLACFLCRQLSLHAARQGCFLTVIMMNCNGRCQHTAVMLYRQTLHQSGI